MVKASPHDLLLGKGSRGDGLPLLLLLPTRRAIVLFPLKRMIAKLVRKYHGAGSSGANQDGVARQVQAEGEVAVRDWEGSCRSVRSLIDEPFGVRRPHLEGRFLHGGVYPDCE